MSDFSQGPGYWQASDGKWYPPDQASGVPAGVPNVGPGAFASAAPAGGAPLASWGQRVVATLIDGAITLAFYVVVFILTLVFGAISDALGALVLIVGYLGAIGIGFYFYFLNGATGQSPGKALTGLKVVAEADGFEETHLPNYTDGFVHVNAAGNLAKARAIADVIVAERLLERE